MVFDDKKIKKSNFNKSKKPFITEDLMLISS